MFCFLLSKSYSNFVLFSAIMMELIGNIQARNVVKSFFRDANSNNKPLFLLLVWAEGLGKSSFVLQHMQEELWKYFQSDFLWIRDCSHILGKTHTLQVETPSGLKTIEVDGQIYENRWVREFTTWLQQSSLSWKKVLFIENLERMSSAAMNAFLKTAEEPLSQRFVFSTLSSDKEILPTILSRAVLVYFSPLVDSEMSAFLTEIPFSLTPGLKSFIALLSSGRPWWALRLVQKFQEDPDLWKQLFSLFDSFLYGWKKLQQIAGMKKLEESWLKDLFIDALIARFVELWKWQFAEKRIAFKKMQNSNIAEENLLWYTLLD